MEANFGNDKKQEKQEPEVAEHDSVAKQLKIVELFGQIDYDPAYDYKAARDTRRILPDPEIHEDCNPALLHCFARKRGG